MKGKKDLQRIEKENREWLRNPEKCILEDMDKLGLIPDVEKKDKKDRQ